MKPLQKILEAAVKDPEAGCGEYKGATIRRNTKSVDKKNKGPKGSGHEWTEQEWAAGYTVSGCKGIGVREVFTTVAKAKEKIDFYVKFPVPDPPQSDREKAKAKKLKLKEAVKEPVLKVWNCTACRDMFKRDDPRPREHRYNHVCIAAYSIADAVRMIEEYSGIEGSGIARQIKNYGSACWGNDMKGITPERGMWVQFGDHGKIERII